MSDEQQISTKELNLVLECKHQVLGAEFFALVAEIFALLYEKLLNEKSISFQMCNLLSRPAEIDPPSESLPSWVTEKLTTQIALKIWDIFRTKAL